MVSRRDILKASVLAGAAGVGELPDAALQKRMAEYVDAPPSA